ncbi:MAG TPA: tRNA pseudouridine(38-40) synthase TruA [Pyrinomonadaceae bacterium]|jgi:tRNA pseudouridine38-40 synthase|nr:tRNA pseudouridine(38-40) synthase TruA [Pyrinomonadaceae bacterium]
MNYKLLIQYDGTNYSGWQVQLNASTIQGELERAVGLLEPGIKVTGSGRTDAGVHAEGQVANVHLSREITPQGLRSAINGNLPRDIRVFDVEQASDDFHARFSAKKKTYIYRVANTPICSPFWRPYAFHEKRELDISAMRNAAGLFIGEHDWTAFSAAQSDAESRVRNILDLSIDTHYDPRVRGTMIEFHITADGFLRYMVRSIVGTLLEVGRGEMDSDTILTAIRTGDRELAGPTAVSRGLTLLRVDYD